MRRDVLQDTHEDRKNERQRWSERLDNFSRILVLTGAALGALSLLYMEGLEKNGIIDLTPLVTLTGHAGFLFLLK